MPDPYVRLWKKTGSTTCSSDSSSSSWAIVATLRWGATKSVRSVAFAPTPCGVRLILAAASFDGTVSIWEDFSDENGGSGSDVRKNLAENGGWECTAQIEGHQSEVKDVVWNKNGTLLATCGRDRSVWIWECFLPGTIGGDNGANNSGDGEGDFECIAVLHGHKGDVKCIRFAPSNNQWGDGDEILLSSSFDCTIKCWAEDAGEWYCAATLLSDVHSSSVWSIAIAPGGVRMISASSDCIAIWRCYTATEKKEMMTSEEWQSSDGLWKCVRTIPSLYSFDVYSVDCAPSCAGHGRIASASADESIQIYREIRGNGGEGATSFAEAPRFVVDAKSSPCHQGEVNCVRWHPRDGKSLASASDDGLVKIWTYNPA